MNLKTYFQEAFFADLKAGFITAIVALPLAIAFAIASGAQPIQGMYTAIIAGILGSLFGGSIFSITGPTGAMTVIILSTVNKFGIEGLLLAGFLAGVLQILFGLIRLGQFVKFIPLPIISGFTAGIGAIIFSGQIANALGLIIPSKEHIWQTFLELGKNILHLDPIAVIITILTIAAIVFLPKLFTKFSFLKSIPPSLAPLVLSTTAVIFFGLTIPQVGTIPSGLPEIHLLNFNFELLRSVLPAAFTIALLGSIEALLCAVVCDAMTNTKHKSNKELIGQGVCNIILPFVGAIPCTAAIARSAVNIREGAKTRFAGVIHALFLLLILLFFGPIAQYIPKSFLAGVLMVVSVRMINFHEFKTIMRISNYEAIVLFVTFGLTVLTDLVFAVEVGMVFAVFLLFIKLTKIAHITEIKDYKSNEGLNSYVQNSKILENLVSIYTLHGPFFFGALNVFDKKIGEQIELHKSIIILRLRFVSFVDSTALVRLNDFIKEQQKHGRLVFLTGLSPSVEETLFKNAEFTHLVKKEYIFHKTKEALTYIEKHHLQLVKSK